MKPDFIIFAIFSILLFATLHRILWQRCPKIVARLGWLGLIVILPWSMVVTDKAENRERKYLMDPLVGFAPTYAGEMARMNHIDMALDVDPENLNYLELIDVQKSWLKANPKAASIYTYRLNSGQKYLYEEGESVHFVVGCEVDYDKNGIYEGVDETRVDIGEALEETNTEMLEVFKGQPQFSGVPSEDRWGTWVSAYAPIFGPDGKVEAAVGVDFDANLWKSGLRRARTTILIYACLIVLAIGGGVSVVSNQIIAQEGRKELEIADLTRLAKVKFETLVNSIEGVVCEWNPKSHKFEFVSAQAERILGAPPNYWTSNSDRWNEHLNPDDRDYAIHCRQKSAESTDSYGFEYRMIDKDERVIWIRESGNPVVDEAGEITLLRGIMTDVTEQKQSADELEKTHRQLVDTSRRVGMAEVATGVLHNVGNVLNSVNVASTLIHQRLNESRVGSLCQLAELLADQGDNLGEFFNSDPRGNAVPGYLEDFALHLKDEQREVLVEVDQLVKNIEHIKSIVDLQQSYARKGGEMEPVDIVDLVEDALGINAASLARHRIRMVKNFDESAPRVFVNRNKVLQILVNLIRNAKYALDHSENIRRDLEIGVAVHEEDRVRITISDTGLGIEPENMALLFTHGFTTREDGHGFGLHSSEAAAREMGGSLTANSDGPGKGAAFTLELSIFDSNKFRKNSTEEIVLAG